MNIGLDNGGVHAQLPSLHHIVLASNGYDALVQLLDHFRSQLASEAGNGLVVGNLSAADTREFTVHQIGAHLPLEFYVAPLANMLEQQQPEDNLGGSPSATARLALFAELALSGLHDHQQTVVIECLIGMPHPWFPEICNMFGDEAVSKAELHTASRNHNVFLPAAVTFERCHSRRICSRFKPESSQPMPQKRAHAACATLASSACSAGTYSAWLFSSARQVR